MEMAMEGECCTHASDDLLFQRALRSEVRKLRMATLITLQHVLHSIAAQGRGGGGAGGGLQMASAAQLGAA